MEGSVFTGNTSSTLGNAGERGAVIGVEGGGGLCKWRDALLCAGEVSRAMQSKDAECVAVTTNSGLFGSEPFFFL